MTTPDTNENPVGTPAPPKPFRQEMVIHLRFEPEDIERIVAGVLKGVKVMIEEEENRG